MTTVPSFGAGTARKKDEWQSLIRQLVAGGYLELDLGGHGGMSIAEKGHALRRGEIAFAYRIDARPEARSKRRGQDLEKDSVEKDSVAGTPARDPALLPALKTLRLRLAKERRVPAYVIFSDRTLIDMAARQPRDLTAFAEVHGVGAAKLRDFGKIFLEAIAAHRSSAA